MKMFTASSLLAFFITFALTVYLGTAVVDIHLSSFSVQASAGEYAQQTSPEFPNYLAIWK